MANISGKATAITTISPMRWWKSYILRFLFRMITWGFFAKIQERLIRLSFIHFAHWSILSRDQLPHLADDQPRDRPEYDYLLFVSNFNGSWDQYIDAFSQVIPIGLDNIWRWSEKFPGAVPEGKFFQYIKHNEFSSIYYYNATPESSATEVASALSLSDELYEFEKKSRHMSPEEFARSYELFLIRVQNHLGENGLTEWEQTHREVVASAASLS
ncbi:hypothetical protein [Neorhodopirellula pilleata]|uniref:Uncharacterized protein n=1 Tax=Neorhodopirellula pilleata TaxID=2714738 RepID=A0A5C6ABK4_9BACT|nr:hypothetical protein [Neorhodopirellula pilleata]TWT97404.1 hypothetical protein Pla100_25560 [Neorhodopirellula pilleata]